VQRVVLEPLGLSVHLLTRLGVQQVGGRDVGEDLRRREVGLGERARAVPVEVQGSEPAVAVTQREGED